VTTEFSARDRERMRNDVRARVLWSDPPESIRQDWLKKGAPDEEIQAAIEESFRERRRHFRGRGLLDLGAGIGSFLGAAVLFLLFHHHDAESGKLFMGGRMLVLTAALLALGLWRTWRGVERLATGGSQEKAASDVED